MAQVRRGCQFCDEPVAEEDAHPNFFRSHRACVDEMNERLDANFKASRPHDYQEEPGYASKYGPRDVVSRERARENIGPGRRWSVSTRGGLRVEGQERRTPMEHRLVDLWGEEEDVPCRTMPECLNEQDARNGRTPRFGGESDLVGRLL